MKLSFPHLNTVPEINVGDAMGSTGYIDYLRPSHFPKHTCVVKGVDRANREFISLQYLPIYPKEIARSFESSYRIKNKDQDKHIHVLTLFQRYSDNPTYFTTAGDNMFSGGFQITEMDRPEIELFRQAIENPTANSVLKVDSYSIQLTSQPF